MEKVNKSKKIIISVVLIIVVTITIIILVLLYRVGSNDIPEVDLETQKDWLSELSQTNWVLDEGSKEVFLEEYFYSSIDKLSFAAYDENKSSMVVIVTADGVRQRAVVSQKEGDVLEFDLFMTPLPLYYRPRSDNEEERLVVTGEKNRLIFVKPN